MPELPEVETLRLSLEPHLLGRRITSAQLFRRDILILPGDPRGGFSRQKDRPRPKRVRDEHLLVGARISSLSRRGKHLALIARFDNNELDAALGVHLGMTGKLIILPRAAHEAGPPVPHTHALWQLDSGASLRFIDPRRFGGLRAFDSLEALSAHQDTLGPDALSISDADFFDRLRNSRRAIKAALLDQSALAGVGNIYADETLFAARIRPRRHAARLNANESARLAASIRTILSRAIQARGSTLRDYRDANGQGGAFQASHAVYGRSGESCTACGTRLKSAIIGQRTTVWCPSCQM